MSIFSSSSVYTYKGVMVWGMKSAKKDNDQYLDVDEARSTLEAMSKADKSRILLDVKQQAYGTGLDTDDLLGEVIQRVLEGRRRIPRGVPMVTAIIMNIKSVASCEREKRAREDILDPDEIPEGKELGSSPSAEEVAASKDALSCLFSRLEQRLAGDPKAYAVLIGRMEGYSKDETIALEPMTDLEFDAARKKVIRALLRIKDLGI